MHPNRRKLKELQAEWYGKLKQAGFEDIEDTNSPREMLKSWSRSKTCEKSPERVIALQDYFYKAGHFLTEHEFDSDLHRDIWEMHCEGMSLREIAQRMRDRGTSIYKDGVHKIIKELNGVMFEQRETARKPLVHKRRAFIRS